MKLTPPRRLYILGVVMLAALVTWARYRSRDGAPLFLAPLAVAGVAYLLTVRELSLTPNLTRPVLFTCLALSVLWRLPFFLAPEVPRGDISRYVWDGRLQRLGYNPYKAIPADPALAGLHTPETHGLNNLDVSSPYPAGAQLFFRAVTTIHESAFPFKIALAGCDLAIILLLFAILAPSVRQGHHDLLPLRERVYLTAK